MRERSFFERFLDCFLGCVAIGALAMFLVLIFSISRAFGADINQNDPVQIQINELRNEFRQEIEELKNQVDALVKSKLPGRVEFCGEIVPQDRLNVHDRLDKEILFMNMNRKQFTLYIKRATYRYFPYIEKRLKEWGMPDCLKYVAVIESAMLPNALSSAKAYGMWQFMSSTGKHYGLNQNSDIDERADFEKATDKALTYLWNNCQLFKNLGAKNCWPLAMAAYNAGEASIESAVHQQETTDFYDLWLPAEETRQYVYRAIVAKLVMSDPKSFGFYLKDNDLYQWPEIKEITITLLKSQSIIKVIRSLKVSLPEFLILNPKFKVTAGKKSKGSLLVLSKGSYNFKVPVRD